MKKNRIVSVFLGTTAVLIMTAFDIQDNNGKAGRTNSPGESNCTTNCHNSFSLNDGTGSVTITSDMPNWEYMTNDTYNIYVTVDHVGSPLFGFGLECLDGSSPNQNAGTLLVTNSQTSIKNATVSSVIRRNMVHTLNGGAATDTKTFSFKWKAPTANIGNVTFYAAGNGANGDNLKTGDHIYTTSQVATPAPGASVAETNSAVSQVSVFPNPASDQLRIVLNSANDETVSISLYSFEGKEIASLFNGKGNGHKMEIYAALPTGLAAGTYLVRTVQGEKQSVCRVMIR